MTRILLDTAIPEEIDKFKNIICGITTNPERVKQAGGIDRLVNYLNTMELHDTFLVFHQVKSLPDSDKMMAEKKIESKVITNNWVELIYKIPLLPSLYSLFQKKTYFTLVESATMIYDLIQLNQAALFNVKYAFVIHAKNEDERFLEKAIKYSEKNNIIPIAASLRTKNDLERVISLGYKFVTITPSVLEKSYINLQAEEEYKKFYE